MNPFSFPPIAGVAILGFLAAIGVALPTYRYDTLLDRSDILPGKFPAVCKSSQESTLVSFIG